MDKARREPITKHEKVITLTTTQHTTPQDNTTQQHDYNTTIWNCVKPVHGSESYLLSSQHDVVQVQHIPIVCMPLYARLNFLCHHKAGWRMLRASSETASGARDLRVERKIFPDVCISCFVVLVFDISLADCRSLLPMCVCSVYLYLYMYMYMYMFLVSVSYQHQHQHQQDPHIEQQHQHQHHYFHTPTSKKEEEKKKKKKREKEGKREKKERREREEKERRE